MKPLIILLGVLTLANIVACSNDSSQSPEPADTSAQIPAPGLDDLYLQSARALFNARPSEATNLGVSEELVGSYFADQLANFSPGSEQAFRGKLYSLHEAIASATASDEERLNRDIVASITRYYAGNPDFPIGYIDPWMGLSPFIVSQINGPLIDIPRRLENAHLVRSERDALNYLTRLDTMTDMVNSVSEKLAADAEQGWIAPQVVLNGSLGFIAKFTGTPPEQAALVVSFDEKMSRVSEISPDQREQLTAEATRLLTESVYPAYLALAKQVRELMPSAPEESGIWAQPDGSAYYQDAIQMLGDSTLSADEIHAVGLAEVERISAEMDAILREEGYTEGTVGQRMVQLTEEPRFLYEDSDAGRAELLQDLNGYIEEITERMQPVFRTAPEYDVVVKAYPVEIQDGMPGGQYNAPAVDGSKPGTYWINLRDMKGNPRWALKSLTYHEANPGHHWQVALNLSQEDFPFLRRMAPYNAYVEGWALYAEQVAAEIGMYEDYPFGDLGRLQAELFRAVRLVVDTGMHHKRWTREQAIEYMSDITGNAESDVVAEIERYMAWPGQALGYKLGMLKILELRSKAQQELGDAFDLAAFHDLLLLGGAMPMSILEGEVDRWIAEQGS